MLSEIVCALDPGKVTGYATRDTFGAVTSGELLSLKAVYDYLKKSHPDLILVERYHGGLGAGDAAHHVIGVVLLYSAQYNVPVRFCNPPSKYSRPRTGSPHAAVALSLLEEHCDA